jgi:hypothetical protein
MIDADTGSDRGNPMEGDRESANLPANNGGGGNDDGICQRKLREFPRNCPQFCCLSQGVHFRRRLA